MLKWLKELDRILRGDATRLEVLQKSELSIPAVGLSGVILALAVIYAVCMGFYSMFRPDGPMFLQAFATLIKVPALFFLTIVVTFPSLYVFNALVGSRLNILTILRLLIAGLGVNLAVLSSLGTIVALF
jgi:membrane-associated HD superfamily phosphohydrolase